MGIEKEYFIFYGVKGNFGDYQDIVNEEEKEFYEDECIADIKNFIITENKEQFKPFALGDGMGGEYSCYGVLYNRYGQDRWGADKSINEVFDDELINKLKTLWEEQQKVLNIPTYDYKPALHILHHWT